MTGLDEAQIEIVTVDYFRELGYECLHGPEIAPSELFAERQTFQEVMKTVLVCLIAVLTTCAPSSVSRVEPEKDRTIAVLDLTSLGFSKSRTDILSETLRVEIDRSLQKKRTLRYNVLTSSTVEKIFQEFDIQKGDFSDEILIEMGKMLMVDVISIGFAGYLGSTSSISVRVVEVETGRIVAAADCHCKGTDDDDLVSLVRRVSRDLVKSLSRESSHPGEKATSQRSPFHSIAVLDLDTGGLSETEKKLLSEKLRSAVSHEIEKRESPYIIVERARMDIVLQAQAGKNKGDTEIEYGKLLQTDSILIGSVEKVDETYTVKARIIDVESGKTTRSVERQYKGKIDDVLISVIPDMGRKLVSGTQNINK